HAALARDVDELALGELRLARHLDDAQIAPATGEHALLAALAEGRAEGRIGVDPLAPGEVGRADRLEHRQALEREGRLPLELHHQRPARDLRHDLDAVGLQLLRLLERAAVSVGSEESLEERGPRDRAPD